MPAGRPRKGVNHVEPLEGSATLKRRLRVVLETLTGDKTIEAACAELGIGASRFHVLRRQALRGALQGLEPQSPGRPARRDAPEPREVERLRRRIEQLEVELEAERVRTEIALTMPHLLERRGEKKKSPLWRRIRSRLSPSSPPDEGGEGT
jgi:transposase-like protein